MASHREALPQEQLENPGGTAKYSTFPLSKKHGTTEIFGLITPVEFRNIITADEHAIGNSDRVETYTLGAPLMSTVWKTKEWYQVPRMAILPGAWDLIYTQPTLGDDIDATTAGTSVSAEEWSNFLEAIYAYADSALTAITNATATAEAAGGKTVIEAIEAVIKATIVQEYIFSYGSLLNRAGCKMAALWWNNSLVYKNFDQAFDAIVATLRYGFKVTWNPGDANDFYFVRNGVQDSKALTNEISMREFLTKARDNLNFTIITYSHSDTSVIGVDKTETITSTIATNLNAIKAAVKTAYESSINLRTTYSKPVDLARLWAYQLICAEHYTDDQIDYIYNSDIYRAYISDLVKNMIQYTSGHLEDFEYTINGIKHQYDWMSAAGFALVSDFYSDQSTLPFDYLTALFNLNRSLKFKDYFSGAKTIPIAPGDNTVAVVSNKFDVVDVANKSQAAKFRFAIKRIGRKIDEYVKGLFGIEQAVDYHYPLWIGSTKETLRTNETQNTGAAQVSTAAADANPVTANLTGYSGDYRFVGHFDRDSIVVGVTFYDVERLYYKGTHRSFMHVDRFDYFNQYMQFTGDQYLYSEEYDTSLTGTSSGVFGYKPAYEEFKEEISTADAGFVTALPGYAFLNDMDGNKGGRTLPATAKNISPDFIRSKPVELDRFYKVLTGYSLANYFHFIVIYGQEDNAKRPIVYNPDLAL